MTRAQPSVSSALAFLALIAAMSLGDALAQNSSRPHSAVVLRRALERGRGMKLQATTCVRFVLLSVLACVAACAGPNPNPGERTADTAWLRGDHSTAVTVVTQAALAGEPWAQLRLGMYYATGWGVERDERKAAEWYEKAAAQKVPGSGWPEGQMLGAIGRTGYFNQNGDARIAQINLAQLLSQGKETSRDLVRAYLNIRTVVEETQGRPVFFCCEFAKSRYFTAEVISGLYRDVLAAMSPEQRVKAEAKFEQLRPRASPTALTNSLMRSA
jgi:TPR repeat protein